MTQFQKKPVVIEAWQFVLMKDALPHPDWLKTAFLDGVVYYQGGADPYLTIETLEGRHRASLDDWIIRGIKGEIYPCKPDIFAATYDAVAGAADEADHDGYISWSPAALAELEADLPAGWDWLLRSDAEGGGYFANICSADNRTTFPTYSVSPDGALVGAHDRLRVWLSDANAAQGSPRVVRDSRPKPGARIQ